jgi:transcriptional regulator with XRE-family HTH domain
MSSVARNPKSNYKYIKNNFMMDDYQTFLQFFFGIIPNSKYSKKTKSYFTALELKKKGLTSIEIASKINVSKDTIANWLCTNTTPFEARIYKTFQKLGKPKENHTWLSLNTTRGGLLTGPWIQVPNKINSFHEIQLVLDQINPIENYCQLAKFFDLHENNLNILKYNCFYYLLGMLLGDGAMCKGNSRRFTTRRITLNMTKKHKTNKHICKYIEMSSKLIGLRMKRTKDDSPNKKNRYYFYRWQGQCSQLVEWISSVCFKLKKNEVKTYTPVKADWLLQSPRELQISFLQGIADSDGYVDIGQRQTGLISKSSIKLIENILKTIEIHHCRKYLQHGTLAVTMINFKDAYFLPIFNPFIKSYRYNLLYKMNNANRLPHHMPKELALEVNNILISGASSIAVVKMLLYKYDLLVGSGSIQKRMRKLRILGEI